jgi:hypothetical protein
MENVRLVAGIVSDPRYRFSRMRVDGCEYIIQHGNIFEQISSAEIELEGKRVKIQTRYRIVKNND